MENSMQPQSLSDQDRMVPIDTSGEGVEIELENKEEEQKQEPEVKVEETEAPVKEEAKEEPKAKEEELEEYSQSVKRRIDKLTRKMREAERREQAAIEYAKKVQQDIKTIESKKKEADTSYVADLSNRVTAQIDSAQSNLKNAIAAGDVDQQVAYQREIASLTAEEDRVKREKARLEKLAEQKEIPVNTPQQPQVQRAPQPSAKATAWAEKNSWFGEDEVMTYAAYGIHQKLLGEEGYDANSDEYYEEIDKRIKKEFPHKFKNDTNEVQASTRQPVQTVASATRTTKTGRRTVKLTPSQVAIAKKLGVPLEEYAKHVKEA
jgi:hypothetical protein